MELAADGDNSFVIEASESGEDLTDSLFGSDNPSALNPDDMITVSAMTSGDDFILLEFMFEIKGVEEVTITVKDLDSNPLAFAPENPQTVSVKQTISHHSWHYYNL